MIFLDSLSEDFSMHELVTSPSAGAFRVKCLGMQGWTPEFYVLLDDVIAR